MRFFYILLISIVLFPIKSEGQILDKIKKTKDKIATGTIDKLSRDPITTSFKDVDKSEVLEIEFGNDEAYRSFFEQPFDPQKGFTLEHGYYEGTFQSFCIKAGTTPPIEGGGRFYAPIKGPKADIVTTIIEGYQGNPEITQREVQLLLWAIIAKADFAKMKGPVKVTALKLLTPTQIARLSKGALDNLTRNEVKKVAKESPAIRAVLEAENNLRKKYYAGAKSYQEYEEIAMLAGVEPIVPGFEAGRWTKHPDGFYIRYYPKGYARTRTQIYIPESAGTTQFNPSLDLAVPPNRGQRLLQTNLPTGNPNSNTGGYVNSNEDLFCEPIVNAAADDAIRQQMIMQNIPGLAVAIYQNGKMVHLKSYGYSDVNNETPITLSTRMKWASISKSVTGVAAAQLEERGIGGFKITDTVTDYVENWDSIRYTDTTGEKTGRDRRHPKITIDQLLNNSAGIQQYGKGSRSGDNQFYTLMIRDNDTAVVEFIEDKSAYGDNIGGSRKFKAKEAVDVFNRSVLNDEPGGSYHYSSYGFVLAGAAIDKVAPNGYTQWVKKNIIDEAALNSMRVCEGSRRGHNMSKDGVLSSYNSNCLESTLPAGGFESNICDLAKYAYALSTGKFFENQKDILWNNSVSVMKSPTSTTNYSYGLNYTGSGENLRVWHGGHGGNVRSHMQFFPSDSTGIAIIAPAIYSDLPELTRYIFQAMNIRPTLYNGRTHSPMDWCRTDMENDNDLFNAVWRKTGNDVVVRTGRSNDEFYEEVKRLRSSGYHCKDIEAFVHNGKLYWDGVFQKGIFRTGMWRNASKEAFVDKFEEMRQDGYRLYDVETYINEEGKRLWAGVFRKTNDAYSVRLDRSTSEFAEIRDRENANGKKLIDVEVYMKNGKQYWSGVFTKGEPNKLNRNYSVEDFNALVQSRRAAGYKLIDVEYYETEPGGEIEFKVAGIWEKSSDVEKRRSLDNFCDIMDKHHEWSADDYELIDWNRVPIEVLED